jgi:hypothetical protein
MTGFEECEREEEHGKYLFLIGSFIALVSRHFKYWHSSFSFKWWKSDFRLGRMVEP